MQTYPTVKEHIREFNQTCADAAAEVEEVSGETLTAMSANKALQVWQKTDQVGTDGSATGKVTWATSAGALTDATFTLNGTNTTTHAALVSAVTTAQHVRSFSLDSINCADEVLIGNVAGTEIFGVIKVGYHQCLKSRFMAAASRRTFLGRIKVHLNIVTAVVTLVITYYPVGSTLSVTKSFTTNSIEKTWEPLLELAPSSSTLKSEVSMTIEDDNAAHPVATVELTYLEAY